MEVLIHIGLVVLLFARICMILMIHTLSHLILFIYTYLRLPLLKQYIFSTLLRMFVLF